MHSTDLHVAKGRPYSDPYLAGVGLGLVLLAAFVFAGRGLGASGAFAVAAAHAADGAGVHNDYFARYLNGGPAWRDWLVIEVVGVCIGGALSAVVAGRFSRTVERGPRIRVGQRLSIALAGGTVMGFGAVLARGCTSGQALTGGALLSVGSWGFMITAFAGAYMVAPLLRRAWT